MPQADKGILQSLTPALLFQGATIKRVHTQTYTPFTVLFYDELPEGLSPFTGLFVFIAETSLLCL